jgi:hypothetical protein
MHCKQGLAILSVLALAGCPTRSKGLAAVDGGGDGNDAVLPSIKITSPAAISYANGDVSVTVAASDNAAVSTVSVYVDQDATPLKTLSSPYTFTWDTTTVSEDTHTLIARAIVDGQTIESAPVTVHVDRTAPTFTTTPTANSLNVALSDSIKLVFSEPLDSTSVTNAAITLASGGSSLATAAVLGPDMKTVTVTLGSRSSLSFPATITESITAAVKDLAGNSVGTIRSWSWTAPLWVKLPVLPGRSPALAIDPQGNAVVSSLVDTSTTTQLSVVRYAPGATWDLGFGSPPIAPGLSVTAAAVAVDSDGAPTVGWSQDHIYAAHWSGTAWSSLTGYADEDAQTSVNPPYVSSIVLDASGMPFVGWSDAIELDSFGYVATWSSSEWQLLPSGTRAGTGSPLLLINSGGVPLGLFPTAFGVPGPRIEIYEAGSWLTIGTPASGVSDGVGMFLTLALDPQDEPVTLVETLDSASSNEVIHVNVLTSNTWMETVPSLPTSAPQSTIAEAHVALDGDGHPFILWTQPDATSSLSLHLARYTGAAWDTTYGILNGISSAGTDATVGSVAIDQNGTPTVTWTETDPSTQVPSVYTWKSNY